MACCGKAKRLRAQRLAEQKKEKATVAQLVKSPAWQAVREKLVGQWAERPEWCCSQLRSYLGSVSGANNDKLRIVMNYLTGTGFRTGRIKHVCINKMRAGISTEIKKRKAQKGW